MGEEGREVTYGATQVSSVVSGCRQPGPGVISSSRCLMKLQISSPFRQHLFLGARMRRPDTSPPSPPCHLFTRDTPLVYDTHVAYEIQDYCLPFLAARAVSVRRRAADIFGSARHESSNCARLMFARLINSGILGGGLNTPPRGGCTRRHDTRGTGVRRQCNVY